ncbi:MAG: hypothetical protein HY305_04320, partial [Sphingobacteriales bacterium]|nr:hypothetical protein [Sphingobacteriales bacterium]
MKKISYLLLATTVLFTACKDKYTKTKEGIEYKIIAGKGKKVLKGEFLEINISAVYNDSVLFSTRENAMPQYAAFELEQFPPSFKEIFKNATVGDSIVIKMSTDTLLSKGQAAPFMKKGTFVYQYFKIENAFATEQQKDSAVKSHTVLAKAKAYEKTVATIKKELA